jgi:hypothetical protein
VPGKGARETRCRTVASRPSDPFFVLRITLLAHFLSQAALPAFSGKFPEQAIGFPFLPTSWESPKSHFSLKPKALFHFIFFATWSATRLAQSLLSWRKDVGKVTFPTPFESTEV